MDWGDLLPRKSFLLVCTEDLDWSSSSLGLCPRLCQIFIGALLVRSLHQVSVRCPQESPPPFRLHVSSGDLTTLPGAFSSENSRECSTSHKLALVQGSHFLSHPLVARTGAASVMSKKVMAPASLHWDGSGQTLQPRG